MKINAIDIDKSSEKELRNEIARLSKIVYDAKYNGRSCRIPNGKSNTIQFGIITDTHFGHSCCREDLFRLAMKDFVSCGIKDVHHAGDVIDGHSMHKGQEFEQTHIGWDRQVGALERAAKDFKNINVRFITGSHDLSYQKKNGILVGTEIQKRLGWEFIGDVAGSVIYRVPNGTYCVDMVHPAGGTAYSLSYKLQRMIDSMSGGRKPNMIICGHYHKAEHMPGYRNVEAIQGGCIESQTPFMKSLGLAAMMGFWKVEIVVGKPEDLSNRIRTEFVSFYEG